MQLALQEFTEQSDRLESKNAEVRKAAAAIVLLSSVGRANVRKTQQKFPCLKAKLRGKKRGSVQNVQPP